MPGPSPLIALAAILLAPSPHTEAFQPLQRGCGFSISTALSSQRLNDEPADAVTKLVKGAAAAFTLLTMTTLSGPAMAVSGGGLDFANIDITGQDFAAKNYKGKDFTQVIAKGTTFANSNLQGCRFYKAYLVNADFSSADIRGAAFEDTSMDGANFKDANAAGTYFGQSLLDVKSLENVDFTDASIPPKTLALVCERDDVKGTNPITGASTRDTLMCP